MLNYYQIMVCKYFLLSVDYYFTLFFVSFTVQKILSLMWSIHTVECYSTLKSEEILIPTTNTTWMKLEDMLLSEIKPVTERQVVESSPHSH